MGFSDVPISRTVLPTSFIDPGHPWGPTQQLPPSHGVTVVLGLQRKEPLAQKKRGGVSMKDSFRLEVLSRVLVRGRTPRRGLNDQSETRSTLADPG